MNPNERYTIRKLSRIVEDKGLRHFITVEDTASSLLKEGSPFDVNALNNERNRIASYLRNNGYFMFNKEDIRFTADTSFNSTEVDVAMKLKLHQKTDAQKQKITNNTHFAISSFMLTFHQLMIVSTPQPLAITYSSATDRCTSGKIC